MGPIVLYILFVLICVGALLRPQVGAVGYIGFVALTPHWLWRFSLIDPRFPFQKYIAIATLIGLVLHGLRGAKFSRSAIRSLFCLTAFLLLSLISAWQTINYDRSWFYMNEMYKIVLMAIVVTRLLDSPRYIKWAMIALILAVGWNTFEISADYFRRGYSTVDIDGWAYMNSNGYALVVLLASALTFSMAFHSRNWWLRGWWLGIGVLDIHAVYLLSSRGAMIGLLFTGIVLVFYVKKNFANIAVMLAASVCAVALAGPSVIDQLESTVARKLDRSAESRYYIWAAGLRITLDYPVLGVGPWAAEYLMPDYYRGPAGEFTNRIHLHNLPLEVATGSGVLALLAYLAYFFFPLKEAFRKIRFKMCSTESIYYAVLAGTLCAMPGYWFASMFNSGSLVEMPYICIALATAAINLIEAEQRTLDVDDLDTDDRPVAQP